VQYFQCQALCGQKKPLISPGDDARGHGHGQVPEIFSKKIKQATSNLQLQYFVEKK